ncbi:MAG: N-acetyltransferase [Bacillota bacterium]|nr:N-acetyltransferase [Bacillota bacterium]
MQIRKARIHDVEQIHRLINSYAAEGLMLPRSLSMLYESLRDFVVAQDGPRVVGTGALHIVWEDLAEVRAVAVDPAYTRRGIGKRLVEALLAEAGELGIPRVFALTYQPGFFQRCGFRPIAKEELPQKVWRDCINCPKFPHCDEVALILDLRS